MTKLLAQAIQMPVVQDKPGVFFDDSQALGCAVGIRVDDAESVDARF